MRLLQGQPAVCGLAFTPDSRSLVAATCDQTLAVWDLASGTQRLSLALGGVVSWPYPVFLALAPNGRTLAAGGQYLPLTFRDVQTGQSLALLPDEVPGVFGLAFAPDGRTFAAIPLRDAAGVHYLRRWDMVAGRELLPPLFQSGCTIAAPAFSPDGRTLAVTVYERGRPVLLFDLETGTQQAWNPPSEVTGLTWLPDGRTLAVTLTRTVVLRDVQRGRERGRLKGHRQQITDMAVAPNGRLLATTSDDGTVRLWAADSGKCLAVRDWEIGKVWAVAFAPDGMTAAAGAAGGQIALWDVDEGGV
jgi:WD40 repeat protein